MSVIDAFVPMGDIPATDFPIGETHDWFDMDSRERFEEHGGHALYGAHDIEYRFNRRGYRSAEFDQDADLRVLAIGCSYVLGVGLPLDALFHQIFAARLRETTGCTVVAWNLGASAASNDYICRILQLAVPKLEPHIVLINFTHASRREYVSVQNKLVPYNPGWHPTSLVGRKIKSHFDALSSPVDDALNLFRNYNAVASLLKDRCWLFSTVDPEALNGIIDHLDPRRYVGTLDFLDKARDGLHPGAESHAALAQHFWGTYCKYHSEVLSV